MSRALATLAACAVLATPTLATAQSTPPADLGARVTALAPKIEETAARGMKLFDIPGVAVGIVSGDKLVYAKGFGIRGKDAKDPVDPKTVFQIGSTTKAFLSATLAIAVDKGILKWDDRVSDLYPPFELKDPWVSREFRVFDLTAQRSGLPPYVNDGLSALGYDESALIRSLRHVPPLTSFRSTFGYTNITHLVAGRMLAHLQGETDWNALVAKEIFSPLGMKDTSATAEAMEKAPNHAIGHRFTLKGSAQIPFDASFPYLLGPAGNLNSTVEDVSRWLRLQIANGTFEGKRIVSAENLDATRVAKVGMTDTAAYAQGWLVSLTPHGRIIWHNGGTNGFGTHVGFLPDYGLGVIVLSNLDNQGFPDALAMTIYDALIDNPSKDYVAAAFDKARAGAEATDKRFTRPASPASTPDLAQLAGAYASDILGEATLDRQGDRLVLTLAQTGAKLSLEPFNGAVFTVRLVAEGRFAPIAAMGGDEPLGFINFGADANGKLSAMTWLYDDVQSYPFKRK